MKPFHVTNRVLWVAGICTVVLVGAAATSRLQHIRESPADHALRLAKANGIRIEFGPSETFFTPPYGPSDATRPGFEAKQADPESAGIALEGIESALKVYPPGFVAKLIKAIFICGTLRMDGAQAGGTAGPAWIILSAPVDANRETIFATSELGVHHELSSHVLGYEPETSAAWTVFAPASANFVTRADEALARERAASPDPETGFLSAYGATNAENDFNTYAEKMFTEPSELVKLARKHGLVRHKLHFVIDRYERVDQRLRHYFSSSGLLDAANQ